MRGLGAWLGAALVIAVGTSSPGAVKAAQDVGASGVKATVVPRRDVGTGHQAKRERHAPSWRGVSAIRERVRSASADLGIPVTVSESPGGLVCLRAGDADGPTVVVIPSTAGDGLGAGSRAAMGLANLNHQASVDPVDHLGLALEDAIEVLRGVCLKEGRAAQLGHASVLIVLGPGKQLAEAMGKRSAAQLETAFDLNFPWRWDEARRARSGAAGPYPASRPDVLALSDLLLSEPRVSSVVRAVPTALGPHSAPASLAAFVKGRLKLEHRSPSKASGLEAEIVGALRDLPELQWSKPVWRRLGSNSWVVDLLLENVGSRPSGPSPGPAKELRLPRGIRLNVQIRGESYRWIACGAAPRLPVALQDHGIRGEGATLASLGPGEALRVRLVLSAEGKAAAGVPVLDISAASGRALGADFLGLTPPVGQ